MTTSYTQNTLLQKPATSDRHWDVSLNANSDLLDSLSAIGQLMVTPTEFPSLTLNVRVSAGCYVKADGTIGRFSGIASLAMTASQTTSVWLADSGVVSFGATFPATAHVRLGVVTTTSSSIGSVADARVASQTAGTGLGFVLKSGDVVAGTFSVVSPTSAVPVVSANPSTPSMAFFGAAPATQATAVISLVDNSTGTASNTIGDVGGSFSQATIDNNMATLASKINALIAAMKRHGLMAN